MTERGTGSSRLFGFRQGDRSEYLALYALTRVAFVTPVPRQEDFGVVDFRCVLARHEANAVIPKGTFNVQVKSDSANLRLRAGDIRLVSTNMDSPLFICIVDKEATSIELFSCQNVWSALFFRMHPQTINLIPGVSPNGVPYMHRPLNTGSPAVDIDGEFDVFLGQPVLKMTVDELEARADQVVDLLDEWISLDRFNVALMRLGRAATWAFESASPNERPVNATYTVFNRPVNKHGLLDKICPILESLSSSYQRDGRPDRASEIDSLVASFRADIGDDRRSPISRLLG